MDHLDRESLISQVFTSLIAQLIINYDRSLRRIQAKNRLNLYRAQLNQHPLVSDTHIPLDYWFTKLPKLSLPIFCTNQPKISINLELRSSDDLNIIR